MTSILSSILTSLLLVFIAGFGAAIGSIFFIFSAALLLNLVVDYDHFGLDSSSLFVGGSFVCFGVLKLAPSIVVFFWTFTAVKDSCSDVLTSFFCKDVYDVFDSGGATFRFNRSSSAVVGFSMFDFFNVGRKALDCFGMLACF